MLSLFWPYSNFVGLTIWFTGVRILMAVFFGCFLHSSVVALQTLKWLIDSICAGIRLLGENALGSAQTPI